MARPNFIASLFGVNEKIPDYTPDPMDPEGNKALDGGPLNVVERLGQMGLMKQGDLIMGDHAAWRYAGWPDFTPEEEAELHKDLVEMSYEATRELEAMEKERIKRHKR
jgi:hypothetical protein